MRRFALLLLALSLFACGKTDDGTRRRTDFWSWDPATEEFGFHTVNAKASDCVHVDLSWMTTTSGHTEDVTDGHLIHDVAADRDHTYFIDGESIRRSTRDGARFSTDTIAREQDRAQALTVTDDALYWIAAQGEVRAWPKGSRELHYVALTSPRPERMTAFGSSVFWVQGTEIQEANAMKPAGRLNVPGLSSPLLAADKSSLYGFNEVSLLRIPRDGSPPTSMALTETRAVGVAIEGKYVYWLEEGPPLARCNSTGGKHCTHGYEMKRGSRPQGKLRRISLHGGKVEELAKGLPDAKGLTFVRGVAYVATEDGVFRIDPSTPPIEHMLVVVAPADGAPVSFGEGVLLPRHSGVALLSVP